VVIASQMTVLRIFNMKKSYRFLSGVDDAAFCQRVSDVLAEGYILYGNPVMVMDNGNRIVGQAVTLPDMTQDHQALKQD
jgi:hypothetical protein